MSIESQIKAIIDRITKRQGEVLRKYLAATFLLGFRQTGARQISALQKEQINKIFKEQLGYIAETNDAMGEAMATAIKDRIAQGGSYADISKDMEKFVRDAFGEGGVDIDRTGQIREFIEVGKDGTLRRVKKEIVRPYHATIDTYSDLVGRTSGHAALEAGRVEGYKKQGVKKVRFTGSSDERTRPWHGALLGNVYDVGSDDYYLAMKILSEPYCRHRFIPYFDDERFDTPQSHFDKMKEDAGLFWDSEKEQWTFSE